MKKEIKKKIVKNWFKILQDVICYDIEIMENKSNKFISKQWTRNNKKMKEAAIIEF